MNIDIIPILYRYYICKISRVYIHYIIYIFLCTDFLPILFIDIAQYYLTDYQIILCFVPKPDYKFLGKTHCLLVFILPKLPAQ